MKKSARQIAFDILLRIEKDNAYSNLILDGLLGSSQLDTRDKAFVSALIYGVVERRITLDHQLSLYLTKPLKKLKSEVLVIMRMGAYQALFMDKVPDSAAVNESVKLTKANKCAYASSLVNAVLRKCVRNGLVYPEKSNKLEYLSVSTSCPEWLVKKLIDEYGEADAASFLSSCNGSAPTVVRVNTVLTTKSELQKKLADEGVKSEDGYIEDSLLLSLGGHGIESLASYKEGLFHVQDTASQLCAKALCALPGDTVFDLCSAPGGKAFTVAQYMKNNGRLVAFDLYEQRARLIAEGAQRLQLDIIAAMCGDAQRYDETLGLADRVLCDVPCSGFGIIRRKPEIRYKTKESIDGIEKLQLAIVENASRYVKAGGRLVYSTCTLSKAENEGVCKRFLEKHGDFVSVRPLENFSDDVFLTLMPHKNNTDGFFIAAFERKGDQ